jgi:predicted AlkP superfamily phosphohydrolase/phosphomutase
MKNRRVLAIGLDAAEAGLIEKWISEGYLKNLASLKSKGSYGRLSSSAEWLAGSPWPTFYTGTMPGKHGFYHYLQWRSDKMDYERPNPGWFASVPFWRNLENSYKAIAVDIPTAFPAVPFNGIEISGWASHDKMFPASSYPEDKIKSIAKRFGKSPISDEVGGLQEIKELIKVKDELIEAARNETLLISALMKDEEWDLFLYCLAAPHRGGHKFWNPANVKGELSQEEQLTFQNNLRDIYVACDEEVGNIIDEVDDDTDILVFSLHGMGANTSLAEKLPQMISNILNGPPMESLNKKNSPITSIRNMIPLELRSSLRKLLPFWLQDKMTAYWRSGNVDWSNTKVFSLLADLQGYIRINLKGREKEGVVEKGGEYENLCSRIIDGLKTFKDHETGEPVIDTIKRKDELFEKGNSFDFLPDLLVNWKSKPAADYKKITSLKYGEIDFPAPGKNLDGRSGNHRPEGFLLAVGKSFRPNSSFIKKHHIVDLAPTILNCLNIPKPGNMDGEIIVD